MAKANVPIYYAFNRGIIDRLGLARADLKRTALAAEIQENWMPRVLGSMMLRPGLGFVGNLREDGGPIELVPFIYSITDTAIIELTHKHMRIRVNDGLIKRDDVLTTIVNGTFGSNITGWTDADETGATSSWVSNGGTGCMQLVGTGYNAAIRYQLINVAGDDYTKKHGLHIVIARSPVKLRVGSTLGGDEYMTETSLGVGTHSLVVLPTGNFYIQFQNSEIAAGLVDSIEIEAAGSGLLMSTPWEVADIPLIRCEQSADVVFVACKGFQQRRIERRANNSWSIVLYEPEDGPFLLVNTTRTILTPTAATGDITLFANKPLFKAGHKGALFRIRSSGQTVTNLLAGADQYTDPIRVVGVGPDSRTITYSSTGTWSGTLTLQRSIGDLGSWAEVATKTTNFTGTLNDGLDNEIIYYRWGFRAGDYSSGSATVTISNPGGGIEGVVRLTGINAPNSAAAVVLKQLGGTDGSTDWSEGTWSEYRGWPSSVALHEGRLWWAGKSKIIGSVSDAYASFDDTIEGDSGPIQRSIGRGPVDTINWLLPLQRLILGAGGAEWSARSSSFDEPLTPTNFNLKSASTQGAAPVSPVQMDDMGFFVHRAGDRFFQLAFDSNSYDYVSDDASKLVPDLVSPGIVAVAVQRQPDTRIHCVLANGRVAVLVVDKVEDVAAWVSVQTDGTIEDVVVLPGQTEDQVYYAVTRTADGVPARVLEKWALESECLGHDLNKQADSFVVYDGVPTNVLTGYDHIEGRGIVVWGDGKDIFGRDADDLPITVTVTGGNVTLPVGVTVSKAVGGLPYIAPFRSTKLSYAADLGTALNQKKRVSHIGVILADAHIGALTYGASLDEPMDHMPLMERGVEINSDHVYHGYDETMFEFPGEFDTDSRVCLRAIAPRPVTILSLIASLETNDNN